MAADPSLTLAARPRARRGVAPHALAVPAAVAVAVGLVLAGHALGMSLEAHDSRVHIGAPPLVGMFARHFDARLLPALVLAVAALAWAPRLAARLAWRPLLGAAWAGGLAWTVALAAADGWGAVSAPLRSRYEYLHDVPAVGGDPFAFLSGFAGHLSSYATHVRGHPPGLLLALWGLDRVGLGGAGAATVLVLAVGALAAPAALVAGRALAGGASARAAAPFLALAPAVVWAGTSADGLFAGVAACGLALLALACGGRDRRSAALAAGAGVVLGACLFLSYGLTLLAIPALAIVAARRDPRALALAAGGALAVVAAFALAGFWWLDGLRATHAIQSLGVAARRPYAEFLVIDLAAFALALGPAAVAGLARLRHRRLWVLVGAGLAMVAVADLSGMSKGETERIWLPFAPWLLLATAALAPGRTRRAWLAGQLALAVALQIGVRSPW